MTFERLRHVADPDHLPALKLEDVHQRPALGLGALDPRPRVLLLYGSLRERSYLRLVVEESARFLKFFGCETRIFDPSDLPLPDQVKVDVRLFRWQIALGIAIADAGWRIMGGLCNYRFGSAPIGIFSHARTFMSAIAKDRVWVGRRHGQSQAASED